MGIMLTKVSTPIISWVSEILGWIINGIYTGLEYIGISNIGLAIIIFTLVVYLLMTPLQIKQQRFSKLNAVMQPEIQKIQKKYNGKKDNDSMMRQNDEINAVYAKYGVSPTGSCVQLLIQMPVLLALYQVIYHIPGYITGVRNVFVGLADKIVAVDGYGDIISQFLTDNSITMNGISASTEFTRDTVIDFLYKLSPSQMTQFAGLSDFSSLSSLFAEVSEKASHMNTFLNLNISDTPMAIIRSGWSMGTAAGYLMVFAAIMVPVLAWFTQYVNYKLMPQADNGNKEGGSTMEASMKSMNTIMPIMSAIFCFSFPVGIGIYWVIGAVIRSVQMLVINRQMDKMDLDAIVEKNKDKAAKKMAKRGETMERINQQARQNTKNMQADGRNSSKNTASSGNQTNASRVGDKAKKIETNYDNSKAKPGSIASKANMVKQFDERNSKKK